MGIAKLGPLYVDERICGPKFCLPGGSHTMSVGTQFLGRNKTAMISKEKGDVIRTAVIALLLGVGSVNWIEVKK